MENEIIVVDLKHCSKEHRAELLHVFCGAVTREFKPSGVEILWTPDYMLEDSDGQEKE